MVDEPALYEALANHRLHAAGIDVWSTLNVQHIESLNDVIAQITGVIVRETLPDAVLERANEIELIDLTPEELMVRLQAGKGKVSQRVRGVSYSRVGIPIRVAWQFAGGETCLTSSSPTAIPTAIMRGALPSGCARKGWMCGGTMRCASPGSVLLGCGGTFLREPSPAVIFRHRASERSCRGQAPRPHRALSLLYKRSPTCVSLYPLVTCINVVKCFEYKRGAKSVAGLTKVCRAQGKAPASRGLRCGAAPRQRFFQHSERSSRWMQCGTGARGQPLPLESFCLRP